MISNQAQVFEAIKTNLRYPIEGVLQGLQFHAKPVMGFETDESVHGNGTGYYDPLTSEDIDLKVGEIALAKSAAGRQLVIMKTDYGNIVVFTRYTDSDQLVVCMPRSLRDITGNGPISVDTAVVLLRTFISLGQKAAK